MGHMATGLYCVILVIVLILTENEGTVLRAIATAISKFKLCSLS